LKKRGPLTKFDTTVPLFSFVPGISNADFDVSVPSNNLVFLAQRFSGQISFPSEQS